jgi:hypothetical protein
MSHLQSLTDLLSLVSLSPDSLDKILDHDRWKTETVLEHELRVEELRQQYLHGGYSSESHTFSQDDLTFNLVSSYSECNDSQVFKIAKTKVRVGVVKLCDERYEDIHSELTRNPRYKNVPSKDKGVNMKSLASSIMYMSCCSERLKKWPIARDKSSILQIQRDVEQKVSRLDSLTFIVTYEAVRDAWPVLFENKLNFNDSDLKTMFDQAVLDVESRKRIAEKSDIKSSPLFLLTSEEMPELDIDRLEQYYYSLSQKYVEAGVRTMALHFTQNRPPELSHTDEYAEWSDIYVNYLQEYKEKWKNQLKEIELASWDDQLKWSKESTS